MALVIATDGDLFSSRAQAWVNPVNCVGVMGAGLAAAFKARFPANFTAYRDACARGQLRPGGLLAHRCSAEKARDDSPVWVVNLATKDHWRDASRLEWVVQAARHLNDWAVEHDVASVACPALGAGLGGLDWNHVRAQLDLAFSSSSVHFELYAPRVARPAATPPNPTTPSDHVPARHRVRFR